jgi:Gluconate 2-dehydrogenase subunit 3
MNRRAVLFNFSSIATGLAISPDIFANCFSSNYKPILLSIKNIQLLDEIGETILPTTKDSPGAKVAKVGNFIDVFAHKCYSPGKQQYIKQSIIKFEQFCKQTNKVDFLNLSAKKRLEFLASLDKLSKINSNENTQYHYFKSLKSIILHAYFTSKQGMTTSLRYLPIPTEYIGNQPLKAGEKSWAL